MMNVRVDSDLWIRCEKCGHKLAKMISTGKCDPPPQIEIKCHSCKKLNMVVVSFDYWKEYGKYDK